MTKGQLCRISRIGVTKVWRVLYRKDGKWACYKRCDRHDDAMKHLARLRKEVEHGRIVESD